MFLGPNRIPIVIDDEVRPLGYLCGFLLIKQAEWRRIGSHGVIDESSLSSSLIVTPQGRHVWGM